jgi:hypothetical protein
MANTALKASVFDILAYVIGVISGGRDVQRAADGLGVKRQTILAWLEKGIGHLAFNQGDVSRPARAFRLNCYVRGVDRTTTTTANSSRVWERRSNRKVRPIALVAALRTHLIGFRKSSGAGPIRAGSIIESCGVIKAGSSTPIRSATTLKSPSQHWRASTRESIADAAWTASAGFNPLSLESSTALKATR